MPATIYKYPFEVRDVVIIRMPEGAEVLSVQEQPGVGLCMWALVDPAAPMVERGFHIFGTGHAVPGIFDRASFVATVQTHGGTLVWHIFDAQKAGG